jgi:hypothetical protein
LVTGLHREAALQSNGHFAAAHAANTSHLGTTPWAHSGLGNTAVDASS